MRNEKRVLHGQDIEGLLFAHELARLLLAGPDLMVLVPDEDGLDDESDFISVGRMTHDERHVYLSGYFVVRADIEEHFVISDSYRHAEKEKTQVD